MKPAGVGRRHLRPARPRRPRHGARVLRAPRRGRAGLAAERRSPGRHVIPPVARPRTRPPTPPRPRPPRTGNYRYAPAPAPTVSLVPGRARTQYFGTVLSVTSVSVPVHSGYRSRCGWGSSPRRAPHDLDRRRRAAGPARHRRRAAPPTSASGIVLDGRFGEPPARPGGTGRVVIGAAVVRTAGQGTYRVDGVAARLGDVARGGATGA